MRSMRPAYERAREALDPRAIYVYGPDPDHPITRGGASVTPYRIGSSRAPEVLGRTYASGWPWADGRMRLIYWVSGQAVASYMVTAVTASLIATGVEELTSGWWNCRISVIDDAIRAAAAQRRIVLRTTDELEAAIESEIRRVHGL